MVKLFISYSHKDKILKESLENHLSVLKRNNIIESWSDKEIMPGQDRNKAIDENLKSADIIILLVSSDFLASDYCFDNEVKSAVERHESGEVTVIPVILRYCDWKGTPFEKLQALPQDARPITDWEDKDKALQNITNEIKKIIHEKSDNNIGIKIPRKINFIIKNESITNFNTDLIVLKHAQGFMGVDKIIANRLVNDLIVISLDELRVEVGDSILTKSGGVVEASNLLFVGVNNIINFRYAEINDFAVKAMEFVVSNELEIKSLTTTVHGVGFGLDERESFLSLIEGFIESIDVGLIPTGLCEIVIVELDENRANRLKSYLRTIAPKYQLNQIGASSYEYTITDSKKSISKTVQSIIKNKSLGINKPSILVLISENKKFHDIFYFGIQGVAHEFDILCEKIGSNLKGGRLNKIIAKLEATSLVIVEMSEITQEKIFELGYVLGTDTPVLIINKKEVELPYFLKGVNSISYDSIYTLRQDISAILKSLSKRQKKSLHSLSSPNFPHENYDEIELLHNII